MKQKRLISFLLISLLLTEVSVSGVASAKENTSHVLTNKNSYSENGYQRLTILNNTKAIPDKKVLENTSSNVTTDDENRSNGTVDENNPEETSGNPEDKNEEIDKNKENDQKKKPKKHIYFKKKDEKRADFFVKIKTHQKKNYPIYKSNPYNVDAKSLKPTSHSFNYKSKTVYVSRTAIVNGVMWYRISYKGKLLGWVEKNGISTYYKNLNVKVISQLPQLPTGCEITAVTMMLQYTGAKVNKMKMAKEMPKTTTKNGNLGFVGSPYKKSGWWIFPPALMKLVKKYTGSSINMTGSSYTSVKKQINRNHPVVIWVVNVDGFVNHALTVTGYSNTRVFYNDPWTGKKSSMTIKKMKKHWKANKYRAISY